MNRPSPDDMKAMQVMEYVEELEKEYKKLKEENKELKAYKSWYILLKERINGLIETQKRLTLKKNELEEENKKMKEELAEQIDGWNGLRDEIEYLKRENKRLKKDLEYYIKFYDEHDWPIDRWAYDNEDGLLYEEWLY